MSDSKDENLESGEFHEFEDVAGVVLDRNKGGRPIGSRVQNVLGHVNSKQQQYDRVRRLNKDAKNMAAEMESQMEEDVLILEQERIAKEKADREAKVIESARKMFELQEAGFATIHGQVGSQNPVVVAALEAAGVEGFVDYSHVEGKVTPWGSIHESILDAEIADERFGGPTMVALAKRLRVTMEDIAGIWNGTDEAEWAIHRMDKLLELEQLSQRGFNWDRLEQGVLSKLVEVVSTRRLTTAEYLAIGRVANTATRRGAQGVIVENKIPATQGDVNVNVQVNNGGGLPGPGSIGTIQLNLSNRTVQQLSQPRVIDGTVERSLDNMEMLTSKDIKELNAVTDSRDE